MAKLTTRFIEALKGEPSRRVEVQDDDTPGLYIRVSAKGAKSWMLRCTAKEGRRIKAGLGKFPGIGLSQARERARKERGLAQTHMIVAESAHAAFHKAAHIYDIKLTKTKVRADWTADTDAMANAITPNTVLIVGSAPQYPQGVVDDIPAIASLARAANANCHVDACMGGFVLPFVEKLGRPVPPWDFRVDGVTSISADIHKLGYAPKGASVVLYRDKNLRAYQTFTFDDWLGGFYASPNLQGTRSGLPMATAWAVMQHLGMEGYLRLTAATLRNADQMRARIAEIDGLRVLGAGTYHLVALAADPAWGYLARYWAGFASWRLAINGASHGMSAEDLRENLETAAADFEASIRLREDFADESLGMPRDLDGNNKIEATDHSKGYILLPVKVRIEWKSGTATRHFELVTQLGDHRLPEEP